MWVKGSDVGSLRKKKETMMMNSKQSVTASIITNITWSYITLSEVIMKNWQSGGLLQKTPLACSTGILRQRWNQRTSVDGVFPLMQLTVAAPSCLWAKVWRTKAGFNRSDALSLGTKNIWLSENVKKIIQWVSLVKHIYFRDLSSVL